MTRRIKTQFSGKLSKDDDGVFQLKKKLEGASITVEFPFGDRIVTTHKGIPVTFKPTTEHSFYDVELAFFSAIKTNPIHVVHDKYGRQLGYIGESASIEISYALLRKKPIVMLYPPVCSDKVPKCIQELVRQNKEKFFVTRIDNFSNSQLLEFMEKTSGNSSVYYNLCDIETEIGVMNAIARLFESYRMT